jgi:hypothetical protein
MPELFGRTYNRSEILARVGDISQLARAKPYRLIEGLEDGSLAIDVTNGTGLEFTVLASRGMDISTARYNGRPLAWRSATTDTHPAYFDHEGENGRGWLRGFYGGLVVTCGLSWAGANDIENGRQYGLHGRISNLPATNVSWDGDWIGDDYEITIRGKMREATVFGENLELERIITTHLGSRKLSILDRVRNLAHKPAEHMMLYHINIGFPAVNDGARLVAPTLSAEPRDADAVEGAERYAELDAPLNGYREKCYFHSLVPDSDCMVTTAIIDETAASGDSNGPGFGVYCRYNIDQLPRFTEWKMLDAGTYVVGMEPANCSVLGRPKERAAGTLQVLQPGEEREYEVEIGVLSGTDEVRRHIDACTRLVAESRSANSE